LLYLESFLFLDRKIDEQNEAGTLNEEIQEPRISVQNNTEIEISGDGFRWRKYGQKVVKGNPYPRLAYTDHILKLNFIFLCLSQIESIST